MKLFLTLILIFCCSLARADSETDLVNSLISLVPYGLHKGKNLSGQKCLVEVTKDESLPIPQIHKSRYQLEIFSINKHGWYGWTDFTPSVGGFGDCPHVFYNTGTYLEIRNTGSSVPCLSFSKKSNMKGLKIVSTSTKSLDVITLTEKGETEATCSIEN